MKNKIYIEPFFKVVRVKSEDVITTSFQESAFSISNGFTANEGTQGSESAFGGSGTTELIIL